MSFKKKLKSRARSFYKFVQYRRYRSLLDRNARLKDKFLGKRIFVLGDGASLNDIALPRLADEYTMACNFIMLHPDFEGLNLSFYAEAASLRSLRAASSKRVMRERGLLPTGTYDKALLSLHEKTRGSSTRFFFDVSMKSSIESRRLFPGHEIFYTMSGHGLDAGQAIETDMTKPLSTMEGSLYYMVSLSLEMGFKEIYLCGCGYTYSPQQLYHFYEDNAGVAADEVDFRHRLLQGVAIQKGVTIYNVVPKGFESPVYRPIPVVELETVLSPRSGDEGQKRAVS